MPHYTMLGKSTDADSIEAKAVAEKDVKEIWSDWLAEIKHHLTNFSLENIALSPNDFVGKTKFPISAWHTLSSRNYEVVLYRNAQTEPVRTVVGTSKKETTVKKSIYTMFVYDLKEEVFDNIIRVNDEISNKSTKYIAYKRAQTSMFIGKIGVRDNNVPAGKIFKRGKIKEVDYESKNVKTNVKDVDLPIAMKYRNYRNMPKKIEVAPSRIHKNGLFATDE